MLKSSYWFKIPFSVRDYIAIIILAIIAITGYFKIFYGFFQQDEWMSFSLRFLIDKKNILEQIQELFLPSVGHYQPLNTAFIQTAFHFFKLDYVYYAGMSLILHVINTVLMYQLYKMVSRSVGVAFFAAAIFGVSSAAYQATAWVMADVGIHLSVMLATVCLICFFYFLQSGKDKLLYLSVTLLIASLLFKEITLGTFLLLPIAFYLFKDKSNGWGVKQISFVVGVVAVCYLLFRLVMVFIPQAYTHDSIVIQSQTYSNIFYNATTLPLKTLVQSILPIEIELWLVRLIGNMLPEYVTGVINTPEYDVFTQKYILEGITAVLSVIFALFLILLWKLNDNIKPYKKIIIFALCLIVFNAPIFALAPERSGKITVVDSRNLYYISVGSSLLVSIVILNLFKGVIFKSVAAVMFIGINLLFLHTQLNVLSDVGLVRKKILNQIIKEHPMLPERVVFYTESDKSLYGLPPRDRIMPFQSGFGQTLLIWYFARSSFPDEFIKNRYLWEIGSQGYKEIEGTGFGYFRNFESLTSSVQTGFDPGMIIAYRFDSETDELQDISRDIRSRLEGYLAFQSGGRFTDYTLSTKHNTKDIGLMHDNNRETYWSSGLEIIYPQSLIIDIGSQKIVCLVRVDSNKDIDQDKVGYRVDASRDGGQYSEVFSSLIYPPNENGLVDLYFKPVTTRFIKVTQEGRHEEAFWRIAELKILQCEQ